MVANCATDPADAEAALDALAVLDSLDEPDASDALDDTSLVDVLDAPDAAALAELLDDELAEDDACDEPQPKSPNANVAASATAASTFLFMVVFLSPGFSKFMTFSVVKHAGSHFK
jgi:hypothetical protein